MYINFWYPVALSEEVTAEAPCGVQILGLKFVAFRDSDGKAHVVSNTCIHRGGSLSHGKIVDGCVQCPYHGWQFRGDGKCVKIPTLAENQKPPARAKIDSYPVEERYGVVFAFLGDAPEDERPPVYDVPEYHQDGWRANKMVVFDVNYYYERSIENGLDAAHNEFVHPKQGAPGLNKALRGKPIEVTDVPWGSQFKVQFGQQQEGLLAETTFRDASGVIAGSGHQGPNNMVTWIQFNESNIFHQYFFEAPIDESHTRIFFLNMRSFMLEPENDDVLIDVNRQIAQEDIDVLVNLDPVRTPDSNAKELLMPTDSPVVRYRECLKEWDSKGWRIDTKRVQKLRGDVAFAVPCPERRTAGNWVLDPVPVIR